MKRKITGQNWSSIEKVEEVESKEEFKISEIDKIHGALARKTVNIDWENTVTGDIISLSLKVLNPGEIRILQLTTMGDQVAYDLYKESNPDPEDPPNEGPLTLEQAQRKVQEEIEEIKNREKFTEFQIKVVLEGDFKNIFTEDFLRNNIDERNLHSLFNTVIGKELRPSKVATFPKMD